MKHTIAVLEDNPTFQQALRRLIEESDAFLLNAIYTSAEEARQMIAHPPDIAIIDIQLPGKSGLEFIKWLHVRNSAIQCLVCSLHDDDAKIVAALENGACGYILKDSKVAEIKKALLDVADGGAPMSPYIARRVVSFFRKPVVREEKALLSEREQEVLQLLATGLQYKEIAVQLYISVETVKKHLKNIYGKLHVQNKVEALNKFRLL